MPGIAGTMHEFKEGTLHSGSKHGPVVKSRKQAVAIGISQERKHSGDSLRGLREAVKPSRKGY